MRRVLITAFSITASALVSASAWAEEPAKEPDPPPNPQAEIGDRHDQSQKDDPPGASSPARPEVAAASEPPKREDKDDPIGKFTVGGYVETFYQWNFNRPGNGISNYRGYDTRHNSITIQNAVVDVGFRARDLLARVALQVGHAPANIYQDEPRAGGSDGAASSDDQLWRFLQRASLGWQATEWLLLEAGIFPAVTGVESLAVKENWNWSRSTVSVRLPTYMAGARATANLSPSVDVFLIVSNGWNSIVDNNDEKSGIVGVEYKLRNKLTASGSYFGGVERDAGAPEGRAWRHGVEAWAQWDILDRLQLAGDASAGFEHTRFGTPWWSSGALYARGKVTDWLFLAIRGERLWEDTASNGLGTSSPILVPSKYVTSGTATIDVRPIKGLSTRLEYRHDAAQTELYFRGDQIAGDGTPEHPYEPNAKHQSSVLLGIVAWL